MEHAQRDKMEKKEMKAVKGLNPCFNGTCSKRKGGATIKGQEGEYGLNPCFNGTCSKSENRHRVACRYPGRVLILVLMEHAQRG